MKRTIIKATSLFLVLVMLLSCIMSCNSPQESTDPNKTDTQAQTETNANTNDTVSTDTNSSDINDTDSSNTDSESNDSFTNDDIITDITTESFTNGSNTDVDSSTDNTMTESSTSTESNTAQGTETVTPEDTDVITVFANNAYVAEFIRADLPDTLDKETYDEVRALFKARVSVNPKTKTDFVGVGREKYNGPAILIGQTNYPESQEAYKKLKDGEASATLVGNKYVIAFTSDYAADKLLVALKSNLNKKATKTEIKINADWNINAKVEYITSGDETFDETGLIKTATLPNLGTSYTSSQDTRVCIQKNATKATYTALCKSLEDANLKKYTSNAIGNNLFSTYITQTQIVNVMFFPNLGEIRTAVDKRGTGTNGFVLPGLSGENKYIPTQSSLMTLVDIENSSWPGGMCLIFKLCDGRFVVVDSGVGGRDNDGSSSGWVYASLAKHAKDPKNIEVAAWIITHVHSDHAGGLVDMVRGTYNTTLKKDGEQVKTHNVMPREAKKWIKIDTIIYNQPKKNVDGRDGWMNEIITGFNVKNVIKAHPGQVFYYANCKFTMYGSLDLVVDKTITNHNDESLSMMFEFNGKKFLVLGDAYPQNTKALATIYKESLKADIVQVSHHGYDNTDAAQVYKYVQATMVMWPVAGYEKDQCNLVNANVNAIFKSIPSTMQFTPRGQNIDFNDKWKMSSKYSLMTAIPFCDCTSCKSGTPIRSSGN